MSGSEKTIILRLSESSAIDCSTQILLSVIWIFQKDFYLNSRNGLQSSHMFPTFLDFFQILSRVLVFTELWSQNRGQLTRIYEIRPKNQKELRDRDRETSILLISNLHQSHTCLSIVAFEYFYWHFSMACSQSTTMVGYHSCQLLYMLLFTVLIYIYY